MFFGLVRLLRRSCGVLFILKFGFIDVSRTILDYNSFVERYYILFFMFLLLRINFQEMITIFVF